jgi:hypothetical protein
MVPLPAPGTLADRLVAGRRAPPASRRLDDLPPLRGVSTTGHPHDHVPAPGERSSSNVASQMLPDSVPRS